jgi:thioredoxin reductase (NADPH)
MENHHEAIIIGSGPSGMTAAIYLARASVDVLCIEGMEPSALTTTTDVENFPGFSKGIMGPELMDEMRDQAERFGTKFLTDDVTSVDLTATPKVVRVGDKIFTTNTVVVSTGAKARMLGIPNEQRLTGFGISTCATCDSYFFTDKDVICVGGGDSACEESLHIAKRSRKVTMIHRSDQFRASKIMLDRVRAHPKIDILPWTNVVEILGEHKVEGVTLQDARTGEKREMPIDGLFLAIGHTPNTGLFNDQLDLDEHGYILTTPGETTTNIPAVFSCGDAQDSRWRQAITAAGTGCIAALQAEAYLSDLGLGDPNIKAAARAE